jgi:hypothetical protein
MVPGFRGNDEKMVPGFRRDDMGVALVIAWSDSDLVISVHVM